MHPLGVGRSVVFAILLSAATAFANGDSERLPFSLDLQSGDSGGLTLRLSVDEEAMASSLADPENDFFKEGRIGAPGKPDLPSISRLVVVPPSAGLSLTVSSSTPRRLESSPVQSMQLEYDGFAEFGESLHPDADGFWPPVIAHLDPPAIMRGIRLARVTINPVQVNVRTGEIRYHEDIQAEVRFDGDVVNPVLDPERPRPSAYARRLLRSLVANPEALGRDDDRQLGAYVYVIPNFQGLPEVIAPLAEWRRKQGFPTEVITVAANASNVDVRQALQNAYENWEVPPETICLIGDADRQNADFMIATWDVGRAYMWETDYKYGLFEGADLLPEAAVARISARSLNELRAVVTKILAYETNPSMEDTAWFTRAAVMANDARTGYSSIYLQRWARNLFLEVGFTEVDTFYFIHNNQESEHNFIRRNINDGISIFNYRGWGQFNGAWNVGQANELRNAGKMPLLILPTCNTCDFADHILAPHSYAEDFLWATGGGAIGTIGSSGFTHTNYNNVLDGGIINGIYRDGLRQVGWALNKGKLELYRHFGLFNDVDDPQVQNLLVWEAHCYQYNLIGDPGTDIWTGVPERINLDSESELPTGSTNLNIYVAGADGNPKAGARVTLLQGTEIIRSILTPESGEVIFSFAAGELAEGELLLTASGHNLLPVLDTVRVAAPDVHLAASTIVVDDDNAGRSRGNGDRTPNPGETIELRTYIANFGGEAHQGGLAAMLSVREGNAELTLDSTSLNSAPAMGDSALVTFVARIGADNANGGRLLFHLRLASGETTYDSDFSLKLGAPDLQYASHRYEPAGFNPGDTVWVDVTLRNVGATANQAMGARLSSLTEYVTIFNDRANYPTISPDGDDSLGTARFRIYAHSLTVPGARASLRLTLQTEAGFSDTTEFSIFIGEAGDATPFGPDAYGYVCFDDSDERWESAPTYEWVEIDTALGGDGIDTDIRDRGNEQDWSVRVDLPFDFQYYGQSFRDLTICSNGWLALGDESKLADFHNRRIPPALGPRAQVCVFWDDLVSYMDSSNVQIGGIFYKFDEENHRFIVEWSRMRRYIGMQGDTMMRVGSENTFQAILHDPQHYPTYTGDGEIVLQYRTVNNDLAVDPGEFDTPYATVGIVNLNGTDGMEYTYWNEYHPGAAPLQDRRAIKFTTKMIVVVGSVAGSVVDAATGRPIPGAEIRGSRGSFGLTDRNGSFIIDNVLVGDDYSFTAWAPGYNDSTRSGYDVVEGDTVRLQFALLHPTFELSQNEYSVALRPDNATEADIRLSNEGNGPLRFRGKFEYGDGGGSLWRRLFDLDVTYATGDNRIHGIDFFDGAIWVSGSNNNSNPNKFYRFTQERRYLGAIDQPGASAYGFRGLAGDGRLIWGGEGQSLIGVNARGEALDTIPAPLLVQRAVAYDPTVDGFWVANGRGDPLTQINRDGEILFSHQFELDITGLAYFPADPEEYFVYILSRDRTNPNLRVPLALISKFNPETGDLRPVTPLEGELDDLGGGIEITNRFDPAKWVLLAVMNNTAGHRISAYDLGPNTTWIDYSPRFGVLPPGETQDIHFEINSENLGIGDYRLTLRFEHNAAGLRTDVPLHLEVNENAGLNGQGVQPLSFSLGSAYPNPFNSTTVIPFTLPADSRVRLALYDLSGREAATLVDGFRKAGRYNATLEAKDLPSGIYLLKLEAEGASAVVKAAVMR